MKLRARKLLLTAGLVTALWAVAPAPTQACECLHRLFEHLFCWCRPAARIVEPIVEPRFYYGGDCDSGVLIESGTQPPPAPPADDDYLNSDQPRTFNGNASEGQDSTSRKPQPAEESDAVQDAADSPLPDAAGDEGQESSAQSITPSNPVPGAKLAWQPISRQVVRDLLSRRRSSRHQTVVSRRRLSPRQASHPDWAPVASAPATPGRLASK